MLHQISEFFGLPKGGLCDSSYYWEHLDLEYKNPSMPNSGRKSGYVIIHMAFGMKKRMYSYGEKLLFETEEERDEYRKEQVILREENARRNMALKILIENLKSKSTEELERLAAEVK